MRHLGLLRELEHRPQSHPDWGTLAAAYRALVLLDFIEDTGTAPRVRPAIDLPPEPTHRRSRSLHASVAALVGAVTAHRAEDADARARVVESLVEVCVQLGQCGAADALVDTAACILMLERDHPTSASWRAYKQRGFAQQLWGRMPAARAEYEEGLAVATEIGDAEGIFRMAANLEKIRAFDGNLPAAEAELRKLLERARASGIAAAIGAVSCHLGMVVGVRGRATEALTLLTTAVEHAPELSMREEITANIGLTRGILGDAATATTVLEQLVRDGSGLVAVSHARGHLMELYAKAGRRADIENLIHSTAVDDLPLYLRPPFELSAGRAFKILGDVDASARWLSQGVADAQRAGLATLVFEGEEELDGLLGKSWRKDRSTPMTSAAPVPLNLPPVVAPAVEEPQLESPRQGARAATR